MNAHHEVPLRGLLLLAVALAAVIFVCPLLLASKIPLLDPDEGLHASIAQEMAQRRRLARAAADGKTLSRQADPLLLGGSRLLETLRHVGSSRAAAGADAGAVGDDRHRAGRAADVRPHRGAARRRALCHHDPAGGPGPGAGDDVALVVWVTLAVLLCWESERTTTRRATLLCTLLLGLVLALAILTKGLAGVALVGVAQGGYLLLARRLSRKACLVGPRHWGSAA